LLLNRVKRVVEIIMNALFVTLTNIPRCHFFKLKKVILFFKNKCLYLWKYVLEMILISFNMVQIADFNKTTA